MNLEPNVIHDRLVIAGDKWADALEVAEHLEETKKVLLSQLGTEVEGSQAAKESFALRHPDYAKHISAMTAARKAANKAKVRYDSAKTCTEIMRTVSANERALMRTAP